MVLAVTIKRIYDWSMFANAKEKLGQVQDAAERIASNLIGVLALAVLAVAIASGALYVAVRALKAASPTLVA